MSLRTVFLLCFAAACLPAAGWSAWIAVRAQTEWTNAEAAVDKVKAMGQALHLVEALLVERGALQERALSERPSFENLAEMEARNNALLDRAQRSMRAAGLPDEAVTKAREMLLFSRTRVAEAIQRPLAERDPDLVPAIMALLFQQLDAVEAAMALAERGAARANASVGALVAVGSLTVEMRAAAGRRSSILSGWMGGQVLTPSQLDQAMYLTGQVQQAWDRVQRQVLIVGEPPRLAAAVAATRDGFFRDAEPRYRTLVALARAEGERPTSIQEFRRWTVAALPGALLARDAAIIAAVEYGTALVADAQRHLIAAAAATLGTLALAGGAFLVLLRRLVLPVQRLTTAVTRLADGDVAAEVPERGRRDEIGAMAAAIEVFQGNAVELRRTNLRFDAALGNMSQGLAMYDADERLVVTNARLGELLALPPGSIRVGMSIREIVALCVAAGQFPGRTVDEVYDARRGFISANQPSASFEDEQNGRVLANTVRPMPDGGWLFTLEDITERSRAEVRIAHMAHHDALTGLPNRALFRTRLEEALVRAQRGHGFGMLLLDLDRFKAVNDTLGHPAGDALLRAVAGRLRAELRETDTAARLGGDEFIVLQDEVSLPRDAAALAERIIAALSVPYEIDGHRVEVGASVGIVLASTEEATPDALFKNADLALYRAKLDGRGTWRFFDPEMNAHMQARQLLAADLRQALQEEQFELHYQPQVDLHTHRIMGLEALLRWRHPERGMVPPVEFIPLAEETRLIQAIDIWVLGRACAEAAGWPDEVKVAVNLSATHFRPGCRLADTVAAALRASGLPPARLELEITETAMLQDTEETLATLHALRGLGIAIAMDDFGTGFSSLSHLRRFSFDRVKIDRSFVGGLGRVESDSSAIVRAVMGLCANLGIAVTAEGVETEEQREWLAVEGSVEAQGYLFSRPVPANAVPRLLATSLRTAEPVSS